MAQYRKKPVVIEATQWLKQGDHPAVTTAPLRADSCTSCGELFLDPAGAKTHGWVPTLEGGHIVCPRDYIITGVQGEHYPCKPDIFMATYEPVDTSYPEYVSAKMAGELD